MAKKRKTSNDLQNATYKTKLSNTHHTKNRVNSGALEGKAVPVALVTHIVLL
jgi:hypothetical protein